MTRSSTAAVYGFPLDEENGFPVCLILFSPHFLIEIFDDLIAVINELDLTYELQLFPCRTELHIAELDYFSAVMLIEVLTSSTYVGLSLQATWHLLVVSKEFCYRKLLQNVYVAR